MIWLRRYKGASACGRVSSCITSVVVALLNYPRACSQDHCVRMTCSTSNCRTFCQNLLVLNCAWASIRMTDTCSYHHHHHHSTFHDLEIPIGSFNTRLCTRQWFNIYQYPRSCYCSPHLGGLPCFTTQTKTISSEASTNEEICSIESNTNVHKTPPSLHLNNASSNGNLVKTSIPVSVTNTCSSNLTPSPFPSSAI